MILDRPRNMQVRSSPASTGLWWRSGQTRSRVHAAKTIATSKLRHIKIDVLTTFMNKRLLASLRCPLSLISALICAVMSYHAIIFVLDEWQYIPANERWTLPFTLTYPFGFGLLGLHFLLNCFHKKD